MKAKAERSEVPISAMIDVVFLLLIYFIVTSTEVVDEAFVKVNTPGEGDTTDGPPQQTFDVYVLDEHYEIMGKKYNLTEIDHYLENIAEAVDDISVNIKVHKKAKHQKLVRLLDSLNKLKLTRFSLHTLK